MHWLTRFTIQLFAPFSGPALRQDELDSISVDPGRHKVVLENEQVRVVHWVVRPGDKTLKHTHPDSVNINLTDYNGRVTTPKGTSDVHDKAGSLSWRPALIHEVENIGKETMEGILVEPKKPGSVRPAGSADPAQVDPVHQQVECENEQIRVIREHYKPGEKIILHGHPDNVQVLLSDMKVELTTDDGKTAEVRGNAGEVLWRGVSQHSGQVLDTPLEQIVVEMKGPAATMQRQLFP